MRNRMRQKEEGGGGGADGLSSVVLTFLEGLATATPISNRSIRHVALRYPAIL